MTDVTAGCASGKATILRAADMSLDDIRRYTELVRAGEGNEPERITLLRQHQALVQTRQEQLDRCLDLITFKIGVYEDILDQQQVRH